MANWARVERDALCDLLDEVGPDAPTLCGTWATRDLAAHMIIRESRPDAGAGILFKPLGGYTARVQRGVAAGPWDELVASLRKGPPVWSPMGWAPIDRLVNTVEYFVHHEDVRRAAGDWDPRPLDPAEEAELWAALTRMGRLLVRRAGVGVTVSRPDGEHATLRKGSPMVTVSGPPGELLLFAYGRQAHARVGLVGPPEAVERLTTAPLGL